MKHLFRFTNNLLNKLLSGMRLFLPNCASDLILNILCEPCCACSLLNTCSIHVTTCSQSYLVGRFGSFLLVITISIQALHISSSHHIHLFGYAVISDEFSSSLRLYRGKLYSNSILICCKASSFSSDPILNSNSCNESSCKATFSSNQILFKTKLMQWVQLHARNINEWVTLSCPLLQNHNKCNITLRQNTLLNQL